jgi:hypothetical protein
MTRFSSTKVSRPVLRNKIRASEGEEIKGKPESLREVLTRAERPVASPTLCRSLKNLGLCVNRQIWGRVVPSM